MTPAQWRLSRRVLEVLAAEVGLTDRQLAERLGVTVIELSTPIGALIRQHRADSCWTGTEAYVVLPPHSAEAGAVA